MVIHDLVWEWWASVPKTSPLQEWFKLIHTHIHNAFPLLTRQLQSTLTSGLWHRHSCVGSWRPSIHERWRGQTFAWKSFKICNFEFCLRSNNGIFQKKRLACLLQKRTLTYAWLRGRSYWPPGKHGRSILLGWKLHLFRPRIHWDPVSLALAVLEPGCPPCPPDLRRSYGLCILFMLALFGFGLRLPFYIWFCLLWSCMLG